MMYGVENEDQARSDYTFYMKLKTPYIEVEKTGFWVNNFWPELGCIPDGLVTDPVEVHKHGLLEIKCLKIFREVAPKDLFGTLDKKSLNLSFSHSVDYRPTDFNVTRAEVHGVIPGITGLYKLKSIRSGNRSAVTKLIRKIDAAKQDTDFDPEELNATFENLLQKQKILNNLNEQILNLAEAEDIESEILDSDEYCITLETKIRHIRNFIQDTHTTSKTRQSDTSSQILNVDSHPFVSANLTENSCTQSSQNPFSQASNTVSTNINSNIAHDNDTSRHIQQNANDSPQNTNFPISNGHLQNSPNLNQTSVNIVNDTNQKEEDTTILHSSSNDIYRSQHNMPLLSMYLRNEKWMYPEECHVPGNPTTFK
ncbi:unnamed protein product [Mytilus edulis]|uniref:YqaJ viral recombinase domain-containing protein n=1 Tax=Mytilus edulis TaxID=6550 RepID=A0A8S3RQN1_MYTED|nr:unnamed protein product [Mytilus edulis]